MNVLIRYCFFIAILFAKMSFAQSFTTKVSATTIGKRDVLEIEYVADNVDMQQFVLPDLKNWTLISGPNLSSSTMQTGKLFKQQTTYSVMVQPNTAGTLLVPGATALINNKPQRSNGISVQVKNVDHVTGAQPPSQTPSASLFDQIPFHDELPVGQYLKKGEKAIDKIKNNILIRLEVSKRICYVGEPILATYKLCTRLRSKSKVVKQPQFSGCSVIELTGDDQDAHVEKVNGIEYNVFIIRKVQLFPLAPGTLELPQASVENKVSFYDASRLNYRDLYYNSPNIPIEEQQVTLQNKPAIIEVKALPPLPSIGSSDFSGAIGEFDISISGGDEPLTSSNANKLLFTIKGEGNLQQVKAPAIKWPKGLEAFEATEQTEDDKSRFPVKSRKTFTYTFVADKKGNYVIPPVQFTYFNADANKYVTKATSSLLLEIAKGNKSFFRNLIKRDDEDRFAGRLRVLLGAGLVAVILGLLWFNGRKKPLPQAGQRGVPVAKEEKPVEHIEPNRSEYIYKIRELHPDLDGSSFYKLLYKNLAEYLKSKFNIYPNEVSNYIQQNPEQAPNLQQLKALIDNCSLGMYTPVFAMEEAMQHRLEAIEILNKLEKEPA